MIENLTEAIAHAKEMANSLRAEAEYDKRHGFPEEEPKCLECATEHEQLAAWLAELHERREADKWNVIYTEADLPKESGWYFVTRIFNSRKYVATVFFNENTKRFYEDSCTPLNNIIAWKPLPKPYEPKGGAE